MSDLINSWSRWAGKSSLHYWFSVAVLYAGFAIIMGMVVLTFARLLTPSGWWL